MDFIFEFKDELNKLIENEDNFEFFRNIAMENMRSKPYYFKEVFDEVLLFAIDNKLNKTEAWAHYYIGWYFFDIYKYDKATDCFLISNDIFNIIADNEGLIYACNGLTNVYCQIGQFKLANEWGLKGISLAEETNEKYALVLLLINTGINYIRMKYLQKAKQIFKSIEMIDIELSRQLQISYKLGIAEIEINIGDPNLALSYVQDVLNLDNELSVDTGEAYMLKGMAYVKLNEYEIAEKEFIKSYDYSNKKGYIYEKCCVMVEFSKLRCIIGRQDDAIGFLKEVIEISNFFKFQILLRQSHNILYKTYKQLGNDKQALNHLEEYIIIDDQIYDYEQNQIMAKMNIKQTKRQAELYKLLYDKTELLSTIGQKIISNLNINSIIDIIGSEINNIIKTDTLGIALYDNENEQAVYYFVNENSKLKRVLQFNVDDNSIMSAYCIKNKTDIIISNIAKEYSKYASSYEEIFNGEGIEKSMIFTPLIIKDKVVGVITVQSFMENTYDKTDLNTLKIIANYSAIAIDNAMSYKRIEHIATYDCMTGFLTRFEIIRLGEIIYEKYKDKNINFSLIMIDIDNFKLINDCYGHVFGDKALNLVTETISKCIRTTDYIGRYGGDEFLLICPGAGEAEALDAAERIRNTIGNKTYAISEDISIKITLSLGVYEFKKSDLSFVDGVKMADKYLYKAKKGSKNKVVSKLMSINF